MTTMIKNSIKVVLAATVLTASVSVYAEGEDHESHGTAYTKKWLNDDNILETGTTIQAIAANANKNSYAGNPALENDAWGMSGAWLSFEVVDAADVLITLSSTSAPGMTVYRTDGPFVGTDGTGTSSKGGLEGAVHNFNQVAQPGEQGLIWATDDSVMNSLEGNTTVNGIVETLGYVNGSSKNYINLYGQEVNAGAHDLSIDNRFENGVFGSVAHSTGSAGQTNYANLTLVNLQPGNYTIFVGGADSDIEGAPIDVKVSAIPLSPADCLLNAAEVADPELYSRNSTTSPKGLVSESIMTYYYRYYEDSQAYLGISSDNHLYSLSSDEAEVKDLGAVTDLMPGTCK
ncbi:MAG: hypothetical protein P1P78_14160 [Methyloprofundus sp.]|nr:hypothetical protein [Methyloprofundus sp.]